MTKRILSIATTLAVLAAIIVFPLQVGAEGIADTAKAIKSGRAISGDIEGSAKDDYVISVQESGKLEVDISGSSERRIDFYFYDASGKVIKPSSIKEEIGTLWYTPLGCTRMLDNTTHDKFEGRITYDVGKGKYYLRMQGGGWLNATYEMTVTAPEAKPASSAPAAPAATAIMTVTLNKGDSLQLGSEFPDEAKPVWTTSAEAIATVSANGKVTAVAAGNATIRATADKKQVRIKVIVK